MTKVFLLLTLLATSALAKAQQIGTVTKWQTETFSQSAHIIRNHVVYFVDFAGKHYRIARNRREEKPELQTGDQVQVRFAKGFCFVAKQSGKEEKYQILGVE